ncbi:hypothetical protein [Wolbachia endosymbiont of Aedes albopictus]|uniref:hypothetical protein n=1 Tax=Wolbachia endosymbiont of Aedes albopictus TaxID=167957 RepID=UPI002168A8EB|nr:hypothetical protein [Wolbachia endosymbiont of Aedes albopictus]UVW83383.1 hypothetical protein NHG98_03205 [Wolbachia endosymbiont of Aedes albopictus]
MSITKEVIDALNQRIKDLAAGSTPDQLAYLAKALESIVDKSAVSEIVQMTDGKLKELLSSARSHLNDINTNKTNSISEITATKTESVNEINTLRTNSLDALKESSDSHISLLDTRKNTNIAAINSTGADQLNNLKGLVSNFESINNVPTGSSIIGEIETRDEQLKASLIDEIKTRDEQLKNTFEIISDPEILLKTINDNNLETWLSNTDNQRKFNKMLSNANAVLNITGHSSTLDKLVGSSLAIQALIKSNVALSIIANTTAINVLVNLGSMLANSGAALHIIIQSEVACSTIENNIQNYRSTVVSTLEASSSLFRKQTGIKVGDGATSTRESGRGSATIYVPVSCQDDGDTDFSVNSLLTGNRLAYIARHSGETSVSSGIALRGVQVSGTNGSVGEVTFDVYTAI